LNKANYHIFMGDVVASSALDQIDLQAQLKKLIRDTNEKRKAGILSPYTITLGDEFQGVARSLSGLVETVFFLEEEILRKQYTFKLHYVAHWGEITTRINRNVAYEMMGPGLANARAKLTSKRRRRPRFIFEYGDRQKDQILNGIFLVIENIIDRWKPRDFSLILDMIKLESDSKIAAKRKRDRSLIWRRRETLRVDDYAELKASLMEIAKLLDNGFRVDAGARLSNTHKF
jgi:hypothetical protein